MSCKKKRLIFESLCPWAATQHLEREKDRPQRRRDESNRSLKFAILANNNASPSKERNGQRKPEKRMKNLPFFCPDDIYTNVLRVVWQHARVRCQTTFRCSHSSPFQTTEQARWYHPLHIYLAFRKNIHQDNSAPLATPKAQPSRVRKVRNKSCPFAVLAWQRQW